MNLTSLAHRLRRTKRRRRSIGLAVESIERRLAPSPALPVPPPHVPSMVAAALPHEAPAGNGTTIAAAHEPPDPC
ncbi:MAG: hypothetical protein ACHRXM_19685 [Isosphaerales bacterium]